MCMAGLYLPRLSGRILAEQREGTVPFQQAGCRAQDPGRLRDALRV